MAFKDRVLLGAGLSDIIKAFTLVTKGYDNHKCPTLPSALGGASGWVLPPLEKY